MIKCSREGDRWFCDSSRGRFQRCWGRRRRGLPRRRRWGCTPLSAVERGSFCGLPYCRWPPWICWECTVRFRTVFRAAQSSKLRPLRSPKLLENLPKIINTLTIFVMLSDKTYYSSKKHRISCGEKKWFDEANDQFRKFNLRTW